MRPPNNPCRPVEGLRPGASPLSDHEPRTSEQINAAIRERVWDGPAPLVVNLVEAPPPPGMPPVYRPEGDTSGLRSGLGWTVERPTEGELHFQMNTAIRDACRQIFGK